MELPDWENAPPAESAETASSKTVPVCENVKTFFSAVCPDPVNGVPWGRTYNLYDSKEPEADAEGGVQETEKSRPDIPERAFHSAAQGVPAFESESQSESATHVTGGGGVPSL